MSVVFIDLNARYVPKTDNQDITVNVIIGNGQSGAYVIFLDQVLKGTNTPANLGNGSDIKKMITTVAVTIIDKLKETNWTSVLIEITEGNNKTTLGPYEKQVAKHLDTAIYTIKIVHV